jgi:hypothetical protein
VLLCWGLLLAYLACCFSACLAGASCCDGYFPIASQLIHALLRSAVALQRFLLDDWLDITSRPFVQGHVDAILANKAFSALLAADEQLKTDVEAIVMNIGTAVSKVRAAWLGAVHVHLGSKQLRVHLQSCMQPLAAGCCQLSMDLQYWRHQVMA